MRISRLNGARLNGAKALAFAAMLLALVPAATAMGGETPTGDMSRKDMSQKDMPHMDGMSHMRAPPQACGELTLACAATVTPMFAPDGVLWIVARVGDRMFVAKSLDHARTFSDPVAIDTGPVTLDWGPDARPKLVVDKAGVITVAYAIFRDKAYNGEVFTTRSLDGGKSFGPVKPITDIQESQRFVDLALDPGGRLFAAWLDKRDRAPAKAEGRDYPGAGLAFAWSDDGGATFDKARIALDNTCECCRLAVAFNPAGQPVVLFRDIFPGGVRDHAVITFESPDRPGPARRVSEDDWHIDACPHHGPSLAIAADGSYHATWFTRGSARQGLFYARSTDAGAHFSAPLALGPAGQALSRPFVFASGATIRLAWKAFDGQRTTVMVMTSRDDGVSFGPARSMASTAEAADHPLLLADRDHVFLSWQTRDGYHLIPLDDAS